MRRLVVSLALLALALPAAALALPRVVGDGTLVVQNGSGGDTRTPAVMLIVTGGAVIGQIDRGRIVIEDPTANDGSPATVTGADSSRAISDTKTLWTGTDLRFRAVGGSFVIRIYGVGINVNVVGQGFARLVGSPLGADGRYSLNDGAFHSLPDNGGPLLRIGT
jgi:hypothetical protein